MSEIALLKDLSVDLVYNNQTRLFYSKERPSRATKIFKDAFYTSLSFTTLTQSFLNFFKDETKKQNRKLLKYSKYFSYNENIEICFTIFLDYLNGSFVLKILKRCTAICQNVTKKYMPFLKVRPQFKPTMTSRGFFKPDFFPCILNRILSIHRKRDNLPQ